MISYHFDSFELGRERMLAVRFAQANDQRISARRSLNHPKSHDVVYGEFTNIGVGKSNSFFISQPIFHPLYRTVGLQNITSEGIFCKPTGSDRWDSMVNRLQLSVEPWRDQGDYIGILVDHKSNPLNRGINSYKWAKDTLEKLKQITDRPIKLLVDPYWSLERHNGLGLDLPAEYDEGNYEGCWATVSYNSRRACRAILNGIPNIPLGKGCFTNSLIDTPLEEIENIELPDRQEWFNMLGYTQWSIKEISKGKPYNLLKEK